METSIIKTKLTDGSEAFNVVFIDGCEKAVIAARDEHHAIALQEAFLEHAEYATIEIATIVEVSGTPAGAKASSQGNCQALLESVRDELEGMGFGSDDSIDGGDCCEYLGKLFVDVGEALERDGAKVAA